MPAVDAFRGPRAAVVLFALFVLPILALAGCAKEVPEEPQPGVQAAVAGDESGQPEERPSAAVTSRVADPGPLAVTSQMETDAPAAADEPDSEELPRADHWGAPAAEPSVAAGTIENAIGMRLVLIPAGEFLMGSPESEPQRDNDDEKQHRVRITKPIYLGAHEVTKGEFGKFVASANYRTEPERDGEGGWGWNEAEGKFEGRKPEYTWPRGSPGRSSGTTACSRSGTPTGSSRPRGTSPRPGAPGTSPSLVPADRWPATTGHAARSAVEQQPGAGADGRSAGGRDVQRSCAPRLSRAVVRPPGRC